MKYYGKEPRKILLCLGTGTFLALVLYIVWLFATLGNISRADFGPIIQQGGNIGVLVDALGHAVNNSSASNMLSAFGNMAVASSFLGVSLGLFDFLADFLKFDDSTSGRAKTAAATFVPPLIGGLFFPDVHHCDWVRGPCSNDLDCDCSCLDGACQPQEIRQSPVPCLGW